MSFDKVVFNANWDTLAVSYTKGNTDPANVTIHLGSLTSAPVATVQLPPTGSWARPRRCPSLGADQRPAERVRPLQRGNGVANIDSLSFGAPAGYSLNLITNGDFELAGTGGWWSWGSGTIATTSTRAVSGSKSLP